MNFDYYTITEKNGKYYKHIYNATFDAENMEVVYDYVGKEQIGWDELNRLVDVELDMGLMVDSEVG